MFKKPQLPELVLFLLKWTAIGVVGGLAALALILMLDVAHLRTLMGHEASPWIVLYVLGMSFAVSGATFSVGVAVWVRNDFGGDGKGPGNPRLERWRAGGSGVVQPEDEDRPLP